MSKKLSKYIAAYDYFDKSLTVLSATSGGVSIISFASVIRVPAGIASVSCVFFDNRNNKESIRNNKK